MVWFSYWKQLEIKCTNISYPFFFQFYIVCEYCIWKYHIYIHCIHFRKLLKICYSGTLQDHHIRDLFLHWIWFHWRNFPRAPFWHKDHIFRCMDSHYKDKTAFRINSYTSQIASFFTEMATFILSGTSPYSEGPLIRRFYSPTFLWSAFENITFTYIVFTLGNC